MQTKKKKLASVTTTVLLTTATVTAVSLLHPAATSVAKAQEQKVDIYSFNQTTPLPGSETAELYPVKDKAGDIKILFSTQDLPGYKSRLTRIDWENGKDVRLNQAIVKEEPGKKRIRNRELFREQAARVKSPVLISSGFWLLESMDSPWSVRELGMEKTGFLYEKNGQLETGDQKTFQPETVFKDNPKGWDVGAFGTIVKDGVLDPDFGAAKTWMGDPNERTGRTILIRWKEGNLYTVLSLDGHASKKTGVDHKELKEILQKLGPDKMKFAFMLDGGGSTRAYLNDGESEVYTGSEVDQRDMGDFLYLDLNGLDRETWNYKNPEKVKAGESRSVSYQDWKTASDKGLEKIPGTVYRTKADQPKEDKKTERKAEDKPISTKPLDITLSPSETVTPPAETETGEQSSVTNAEKKRTEIVSGEGAKLAKDTSPSKESASGESSKSSKDGVFKESSNNSQKENVKEGQRKEAVQTAGSAKDIILPLTGILALGGTLATTAWIKADKY